MEEKIKTIRFYKFVTVGGHGFNDVMEIFTDDWADHELKQSNEETKNDKA